MQLVLLSNLLEHPSVPQFITKVLEARPDSSFLVCGDLLNVFPEPGEDLEGSIFHEIYGQNLIVSEMDRLVRNRFHDLEQSRFIDPLREMFAPDGRNFNTARYLAQIRYQHYLEKISKALAGAWLYTIPGNMDYPDLARAAAENRPGITIADMEILHLGNFSVGMLGGIPNTAHPFSGLGEISPYEFAESEYRKRLHYFKKTDMLVTHISPEEYPPLEEFIHQTQPKAVICRAPFNFRRDSDFRGHMEVQPCGRTLVIRVRPFDYPVNRAFSLDLHGKGVLEDIHILEHRV